MNGDGLFYVELQIQPNIKHVSFIQLCNREMKNVSVNYSIQK